MRIGAMKHLPLFLAVLFCSASIKCAVFWSAVYGSSAIKRPLGTIRKRVGNFFPFPGF